MSEEDVPSYTHEKLAFEEARSGLGYHVTPVGFVDGMESGDDLYWSSLSPHIISLMFQVYMTSPGKVIVQNDPVDSGITSTYSQQSLDANLEDNQGRLIYDFSIRFLHTPQSPVCDYVEKQKQLRKEIETTNWKLNRQANDIVFDSAFESGNLQRAYAVDLQVKSEDLSLGDQHGVQDGLLAGTDNIRNWPIKEYNLFLKEDTFTSGVSLILV